MAAALVVDLTCHLALHIYIHRGLDAGIICSTTPSLARPCGGFPPGSKAYAKVHALRPCFLFDLPSSPLLPPDHPATMSSPPLPRISTRAQNLSPPSIEDVLDQYSDLPDTANLAMGVAHWGPPPSALRVIRALGQDEEGEGEEEAGTRETKKKLHGYGPITGNADLVAALREKLETENQLDLTGTCACACVLLFSPTDGVPRQRSFISISSFPVPCERMQEVSLSLLCSLPFLAGQQVMVTAGANQAFSLLALALCDPGDEAVLLAPYYFSHLVALQIAQAKVIEGKWDPTTMLPDVEVEREGGREGGREGRRSERIIFTVGNERRTGGERMKLAHEFLSHALTHELIFPIQTKVAPTRPPLLRQGQSHRPHHPRQPHRCRLPRAPPSTHCLSLSSGGGLVGH